MIRQSLKESFPGHKFSVRSSTYSGGASINVNWIDGPQTLAVEKIAKTFQGSYFDSSQDYKGSVYHMLDGKPVSFASDHVFCDRQYSDSQIERAIDLCSRKYRKNWEDATIEYPSVENYRNGKLSNIQDPKIHFHYGQSVGADIRKMAEKLTSYPSPLQSKTLSRVAHAGDDGYHSGKMQSQSDAMRSMLRAV